METKGGDFMSKATTCCFTGHRFLPRSFNSKRLQEAIEAMIEKGVDTFICGGALGFDTEAAIEVLKLKKKKYKEIKLHIYAPCQGQDARWNSRDQRLYKEILSRADYVDMPNTLYNNQCMKVRNYKMVDSSAYLIAYYDGTFASGTGQTVRYGEKCGLEIVNLYNE
jgi:uncharacterized phage-like protein YoqJ